MAGDYKAVKAYRERHKALGLCVSCSRPVVVDNIRCEYHKQRHADQDAGYRNRTPKEILRQRQADKYKKRRDHGGVCIRCGAPKDVWPFGHQHSYCPSCCLRMDRGISLIPKKAVDIEGYQAHVATGP